MMHGRLLGHRLDLFGWGFGVLDWIDMLRSCGVLMRRGYYLVVAWFDTFRV